MAKKNPFVKCPKVDIPLYGGTIFFYADVNEYKAACIAIGSDFNGPCVGQFIAAENDSGSVIYLIGVFNNSLTTLVHEVCHVAISIIRRAGFRPENGNGEPFCYLTDYLFQELSKYVKSSDGDEAVEPGIKTTRDSETDWSSTDDNPRVVEASGSTVRSDPINRISTKRQNSTTGTTGFRATSRNT